MDARYSSTEDGQSEKCDLQERYEQPPIDVVRAEKTGQEEHVVASPETATPAVSF